MKLDRPRDRKGRKLKKCPHCGERYHLYLAYKGVGAGEPYAVDCIGCGYDFVPRVGFDVVALWNRRAD